MTSDGYALARAALVRALTAWWSFTTADGAGDGSTLIDSTLIGKNDFVSNKTILIASGDAKWEDSGASSFDPVDGTITVVSPFSAQIKAGTIYRILNISTVEIDVEAINTKVGTNTDAAGTTTVFARLKQIVDTYLASGTIGLAALKALIGASTDAGDAATLFGRHLRAYLGTHTHALVVVNDASSLNADLDTALRDFLLSLGFVVTVCDHDDVAANLEISAFDLIVVSASVVTADAGDLVALRTVEVPIVCHSAEIAVSAALNLGGTAATKAAQTQIEIIDNSPMWLITLATGNLTVTASATIYTMATKTTAAVTLAEEADGTDLLTIVKLPQGEEDGGTPAYVPFFDRYFVGVADYTNMNAAFKALLDDLYMHCVMEKRFTEEAVVQVKRAYQEDIPDTDVSDTATTTESECILLDIGPLHNTRFCLRHLRVKAQADPATNTMTVKLYEYFEGALVNMDTFDIDTTNWGTYHSLMDMFGVPEVHSDAIRVACVMDAGTVAVKATYSFAEARK